MQQGIVRKGVDPATTPGWRMTAAGLCALLVGLGLGRFAYTPLIPALIEARWYTPTQVFYFGAANFLGYLVGALVGRPLTSRTPPTLLIRGAMVFIVVGCFACATPLSLEWYFSWRFVAGFSGGIIMVLTASAILPHIRPARRGFVGGSIFSGIGFGIATSGTLVPLLLGYGLTTTWCGLGIFAAILTVATWSSWPKAPRNSDVAIDTRFSGESNRLNVQIYGVLLEYGLMAVSLVPHMVFLVDYVARGLGKGVIEGSHLWVVYGSGSLIGGQLAGYLGDRIGFRAGLRCAFVVQVFAVLIPVITPDTSVLMLSSFVVGAMSPGIVALTLGRLHELMPNDQHMQQMMWSRATVSFAVFQVAAVYGFTLIFSKLGERYITLFEIGVCAALLAILVDVTTSDEKNRIQRRPI